MLFQTFFYSFLFPMILFLRSSWIVSLAWWQREKKNWYSISSVMRQMTLFISWAAWVLGGSGMVSLNSWHCPLWTLGHWVGGVFGVRGNVSLNSLNWLHLELLNISVRDFYPLDNCVLFWSIFHMKYLLQWKINLEF